MIDDGILPGRLPRIGSITTGYGKPATSRSGRAYAQPTRSDTLVLHTNDADVADAVLARFGGEVRPDSPTWQFDVVTAVRDLELSILPAGFRQAFEDWRAGECSRRCDGVFTSILAGRPDRQPCPCAVEIGQGQERKCAPHTVVPALLDLDAERFGTWDIRSTGYGTAGNLKGTLRALAMIGITSGQVPCVLTMQDRTTRDAAGQVRDVTDLALVVAQSHQALIDRALPAPDRVPQLAAAGLWERWQDVQRRAADADLHDTLVDRFRDLYGGDRRVDDLADDQLAMWVDEANRIVSAGSKPL